MSENAGISHPSAEPVKAASFHRFCITVERVYHTRSTVSRIGQFAAYLKDLPDSADVDLACRFAGEGAFPAVSGRRASVGHRTVGVCAAGFCGIDYDLVFKPCRTATGSSSETIERLMANLDQVREKQRPAVLTLRQIQTEYERLETARSREAKQELLQEIWTRLSPLEVKYFIRILGQGSLRIGFEARSILSAVASAFGADPEQVRFVHMITGSLGQTAVLARDGRLDEAGFRLFHPLSFMLATPADSASIENLPDYIAEEKFDGMRCQVHIEGDRAGLYSRDLNDVSASFPEVIRFFNDRKMPATVLDGELCVFRNNTIQPFQHLQKRMGLKKPSKKVLDTCPVIFIGYDVMYTGGRPVFEYPMEERRSLLAGLSSEYGINITRQYDIRDTADVEKLFGQALTRGNEGLMLKRRGSPYEYGQRKKSWLKIKKPGGSIDTVIMYATAGSGRRGGTYSDFTLGVSVRDDERYEEEFIPIGKAYGGYTNDELKRLNEAIKPLIADKFGPTLSLLPGIVVEVEFDTIQLNKRTKAGYTLRLPRFRAIRWDLGPADADTLMDVEELYVKLVNSGRLTQSEGESFGVAGPETGSRKATS
ncbi:MAG: ATP-dependent DNA ligase [Cyclonatronaceae bacterium]